MEITYLTADKCLKAQAAIDGIAETPSKIKEVANSISDVFKDGTIAAWTEETEVGQATKKQLNNYVDTLNNLAGILNELHNIVENLIAISRNNS